MPRSPTHTPPPTPFVTLTISSDQAFTLMAPRLDLLKRAATVCKLWRMAALNVFSDFREYQYRLPTQVRD